MERYVTKADARAAVKGRELEVLQAAGIDWKPGQRGHIDCPYPGHGGSSDWRFDEKTCLCHCTCNARHDVFEALTMLRGETPKAMGTFERSKIEAVELLGRTDLIKVSDEQAVRKKPFLKTWHHFFDTKRLLNDCPPDLQDDSLAYKYLGARQGVPEGEATVPTSPFAGFRDFEFIEDGEVVHRGNCVVFFMVDPDINADEVTGGILIYLSEDGTQKADLGLDRDGNPRKVKRMTTGTKAGGAVLFGDPKTATRQASCEGVETGSGIARAALIAGEDGVLVACGGTAIFMESVPVWPMVEALYVACDRDERPNKKGIVSRAGEKSGRVLADLHADRLPVHLALPGTPGSKTDWLDILIDAGPAAVTDGVFGSPSYNRATTDGNSASVADTETEETSSEPPGADDLDAITKLYPLPIMNSEEFQYQLINDEWWIYRKQVKKEDGKLVVNWVPSCTPFAVTKRLTVLDGAAGPNYALRVIVQGMSGKPHEIDVSRSLLAKSGASDLKSILFSSGLRTESGGDSVAVAILKSANPSKEVGVVSKPGWHRIGES